MNSATIAFIDQEREACGRESIGTLLPIASSACEFATFARVEWFSTRRVLELPGCVRPAEYEARYREPPQAA
jgi:hypothetical protein